MICYLYSIGKLPVSSNADRTKWFDDSTYLLLQTTLTDVLEKASCKTELGTLREHSARFISNLLHLVDRGWLFTNLSTFFSGM
mmetsp:Transcript_10582/g.14173  ORF Transcript_10582/g.14173 Transcript_10582/m.14173 type:complete len:83 (+) Transcript_10582:2-250(+)